jgi:hypothetical protein
MIPVTQTRNGCPSGNCTEASIASLLGIGLDEVPDLYDPAAPPDRWTTFPALCDWLRARGLMWVRVMSPPVGEPGPALWWAPEWLPAWVISEYHLIGGESVRGIGHMVVGRHGEIVWDPHPARAGLSTIEDMTFLVPLEAVPEEYRHGTALEIRAPEAP